MRNLRIVLAMLLLAVLPLAACGRGAACERCESNEDCAEELTCEEFFNSRGDPTKLCGNPADVFMTCPAPAE